MTQYFLSLPHDSAEEPTMAAMDPAELQAVFEAVDNTGDAPVLTDGPFVEARSAPRSEPGVAQSGAWTRPTTRSRSCTATSARNATAC